MGSGFRLGAAGGGGVSGVTGESDRLQASAVVAGHSCLFLGESQQLLPDGLDQGGGGVGRGRCIQGGRGRQISHPRSVEVARGRRRLPDTTSGLLEDRGGREVRTVQELKAQRKEGEEKEKRRETVEKKCKETF